ncbi:MAG: 30S ribosomal protein S12 methylthiotransferase RimO [Oscillospiraceae bacterium]|nr:30S ribosomal protein S12 methylthiotransferase RimO [Oscillospiraceae bacterium]
MKNNPVQAPIYATDKRVCVVSLGCPKNQCDAELMLAKIANAGFRLVGEPGLADVVIINTCGFIQSAKEEAIEEILEAALRRKNAEKSSHLQNSKIIVTGCMSERYKSQLAEEFPEADGIIGIADNEDIVEVICKVIDGEKVAEFSDISGHCMEGERFLSTLPHYAYLRVADGCDNRCAYCAIPLFRGAFRSRPLEKVMDEARTLVQNGVRELILVAQDVTLYGADLYGESALPKLLKSLTEIDNLKWIRLLYCYPQRISDKLIEVIKTEPKIVKYLDIPIQHCNDEILGSMNRHRAGAGNSGFAGEFGQKEIRELVAKLRREIPDIILRTTVMTGFPDETESQFTELAEFVHEVRFEHLGCFAYSQEEGTPAADMDFQVDESERERRREIIAEQQEIRVSDFLDSLTGREFEVVVEGYDKYAELYFGRSYMQAPEIDGMVYFRRAYGHEPTSSDIPLKIGDFITVKITENIDNNLMGVIA